GGAVENVNAFDPGTGPDGEVNTIALQADGSILIGGAFSLINDEPRAGIARLFPNGTLEDAATFYTVFGPHVPVRALSLRPVGAGHTPGHRHHLQLRSSSRDGHSQRLH